jgi:glycine dehydrogenase
MSTPSTSNSESDLSVLPHPDQFVARHIGPSTRQQSEMLAVLGCNSLDALIDATVPPSIRLRHPLNLPAPAGEFDAMTELRGIAGSNQVFRSYIGMGYHDTITPAVILRNLFENPGWYTQYTPYQAEISQGRLEALLNFQTMISDLTGLDIANASMLDEATAAAEAMSMCHNLKSGRTVFFVSEDCHPQTIDVVRTRARALGLTVVAGNSETFVFDGQVFGALVQYPTTWGGVFDYRGFVEKAHAAGAMVAVACDLLALTLLKPPGEFGADIALGSAQRFGVPMGYGGPHAAFFATRDAFKRAMPGRIIGVSRDTRGKPGLRLSLQTREQHIRREKATSNICTAQALLASMASMYAVYHGPEGLRGIARRVHQLTALLAAGLEKLPGIALRKQPFFDTLTVLVPDASAIHTAAAGHRVNLRRIDAQTVGVSIDETTSIEDIALLLRIFNGDQAPAFSPADLRPAASGFSVRTPGFLQHPVFNRYHNETEMLRYLKRLESRDLSLTASMIPLGSCTMKLNAACEMLPLSWPGFARLHPFAPREQAAGFARLFQDLETWLAEITGFAAVSVQPNAGSQGEYAGLLTIRAWHESRGNRHRNVCLIPSSAHGTNPASATMAGFRVVAVACDKNGNIDIADLRTRAAAHQNELAALMVTYPSTHGVFEQGIREICQIVHDHGGQVYMDGANMNAQVGLCRPGDIGADVCHLNLHKTFAIPHGGGGPGVGPIGVAKHLVEFLPGHAVVAPRQPQISDGKSQTGAVSAAPWGSASILPISWVYIRAMGSTGLTEATKVAILNANYIARRLENFFPTLYKGEKGFVAHECILDLRAFKSVTAEDVAKRLMDYGFHAPTLSWPVAGTLMVEPTESEPLGELDRFCDAMIAIHAEMQAVESGQMDKLNNPLKNAPHPADVVTADVWDRPYSRQQAAFPVKSLLEYKYWPPVARIDNVFGDRNLVCTCPGMDSIKAES